MSKIEQRVSNLEKLSKAGGRETIMLVECGCFPGIPLEEAKRIHLDRLRKKYGPLLNESFVTFIVLEDPFKKFRDGRYEGQISYESVYGWKRGKPEDAPEPQ